MSFMLPAGVDFSKQLIANKLSSDSNSSATSQPANQVDYSQLLPSAQQLGQFDPLNYQNFGSVPYVNPATSTAAQVGPYQQMQAAQVDNSQLPGALSSYEQQLQTALQPTFNQQNQQMTAQLSSSGLLDSSAALQAQGNLQGQQAAAVSSGIEPLISQFAGAYNSNNQLNSQQQQQANAANAGYGYDSALNNANFQQNTGQANQAALNTGNAYNSELYNGIVNNNMTNQNAYLASLGSMQSGTNQALLGGSLGSYDPSNTGASSLLNTGLSNASQAYSNAYAAGGANTSAYANALGNLGSQFAKRISPTPVAAPTNGGSFNNLGNGFADISAPNNSAIDTYGTGAGVYS